MRLNRRRLDALAWALIWALLTTSTAALCSLLTMRYWLSAMLFVAAVGVGWSLYRVDRRIDVLNRRFELRSRRGPC